MPRQVLRVLVYALLLAVLCACVPATAEMQMPVSHNVLPAPYGETPGWELLYRDEFEGNALDVNTWVRCYWWADQGCTIASNQELQWYLPDNVTVGNGTLRLEARQAQAVAPNGQSYDYTSGMVSTGRATYDRTVVPGFAFQYGYAEIRAKVPKGQGLWSAFWLLPEYHRATPEIDVLEILGHEPDTLHMFLHDTSEDGRDVASGETLVGEDFSADWHTFAIDWSPNALVWLVDGEVARRIDDPAAIPATPMYLILNLAVGGEWPGAPDATTPFPSVYEIDYLRVWGRHETKALTTVARAVVDATMPDQAVPPTELVIDDNPERIVYLTFDTADLACLTIDSATLRILIDGQAGAQFNGDYGVYLAEDAVTEDGQLADEALTYANRPQLATTPLGRLYAAETDEIYDIRLDAASLQPALGQLVTLALVARAGDSLPLYAEAAGIQEIRLSFTSPRLGPGGEMLATPYTQ